MHNPFQEIKKSEVRTFTSLPAKFRKKRRTAWSDPNRQGAAVDCFLEGPSFDRSGNLWCVDIPFGRIFRISKSGDWTLAAQSHAALSSWVIESSLKGADLVEF